MTSQTRNALACKRYRSTVKGRATTLILTSQQFARKKKIPHTITRELIVPILLAGKCQVTGLPFKWDDPHGPFCPSIDRKNNALGWTPENIQVVIWAYNAAKGTGTHEDVMKMARALGGV